MKPTVVLLHGLGRSRFSMARLKKRLELAGYSTWSRTYPSRKLPLAAIAEQVYQWIEHDLGSDTPLVGVTHSLGGIVARHIGSRLNWQGLVMIAPPNQGSSVAARLQPIRSISRLYGPIFEELATPAQWPGLPVRCGVIAGTHALSLTNPVSWLTKALGVFDDTSDGTVSLSETRLPDADFIQVHANHTWIMNHPNVTKQVLHFIEHGEFAPD